MTKLSELVKARKSVRTFDGKNLSPEHRSSIEEYIREIPNPFDIPVRFKLLDAEEYGLSSPVLSGEKLYVVGIVEKKPYADVAFGYSLEKLFLHAQKLGVGTVCIGGTMKREVFEKAAQLKDNEMMPCISPLGYPSSKRSLKETMMRKGIGADSRIPSEKLFFKDSWGNPLALEGEAGDILELVRWAPSAVNKQPWRVILKDGMYHFYEKKDKGYVSDVTGDMQKIDIGIALCHFVMGVEELGKKAEVTISDPKIEVPENVEYIASVKAEV
ncbi:MAG: nitroreductase [Clostridiales bacterium]|nr:nitroreductase [Clostridiales bacterium]